MHNCLGAHSQDQEHLLPAVQEAHAPQGVSVQEGQGLADCPGQAQIRRQAEGLRWTDQARLPQEGQDHEEGHAQARVHRLQAQKMQGHRQMQDFRPRQEGEHQGTGPLLKSINRDLLDSPRVESITMRQWMNASNQRIT